MQWLIIIICVTVPFGTVALVLGLLNQYGESFFAIQDKHDLNDPNDPRITRLNLK